MHMKRWNLAGLVVMAGVLFGAASAQAQATANGTLAVSATVTSSLQLLFNTASGGPTLTNAGTSAATLPFGNISAYGTEPTGVSLVSANDTTHGACTSVNPCFVVSAPVTVVVNQFNGSSTKFTLTAQLASADTTNFWAVGSQSNTVTSSSATTIVSAGGTYGSTGNLETVYLGVPTATANNTSISNTLNFTVTAN